MKRVAVGVVVAMLVCGLAGYSFAPDRPIVAVFDIEMRNVGPVAKKVNDLTDYLCSLIAQKGYQVVPRAKLQESLQEKKKESYKQCYDQACQIEIGQELSAQKSLSTQVLKLGGECKVTVTIYDLKKSTSEGAAVASGGCDEAKIVKSIEKAVEQLVGGGAVQPPLMAPQPAPPVEKAGLTWVKSVPAGIEFTKSEVTVAQYRACVEAGKCSEPSTDGTCNWSEAGRDQHPVNCVDWNQATAFCAWAGGRLPTEQELIAELSDNGQRKYPWGNTGVSCDKAIWSQGGRGCGRGGTWPVCSKPAGNSVSGLCDLAGNVWEWTSSAQGGGYAVRGGSWFDDNPDFLSPLGRFVNTPTDRQTHIGFRCGRSSTGTSGAGAKAPDLGEYEKLAATAAAEDSKRKEADKKALEERQQYLASLEKAWESVKKVAATKAMGQQARAGVVRKFLQDFAHDNPHEGEAKGWIASLDQGKEPFGQQPGDREGMVKVPAGEFMMGCSPGDGKCSKDEKPPYKVWVSEFWMDKTEVTVAAYRKCVEAGKCTPAHFDDGTCLVPITGSSLRSKQKAQLPESFRGDNHPVVCVDWNQAKGYCEWAGKRLPTEAEWEKAARGGTTGAWYGDLDQVAWYDKNSDGSTHLVGKKQANAFGLFDMLGNAFEWCADWYGEDFYQDSSGRDPGGPGTGKLRVVRGGCWDSDITSYFDSTRASHRLGSSPDHSQDAYGIRCAGSADIGP